MRKITKLKKLYVEITNVCNLSCSFCSGTDRESRTMSVDEFDRVLEQFAPFQPQVYLHVLGEPLMHPMLESILDRVSAHGLVANITTNGTLLVEKGDILLKHEAVRKVNISMHSLEGRFDDRAREYLDGIIQFGKKAIECGRLYINYRMWTGSENYLAQLRTPEAKYLVDAFGGVLEGSYQDGYQSYKLGENVYICFASLFEWPSLDKPEVSYFGTCRGARDMLAVLADGTLVPCCLDANGVINLGNVLEQDLSMILATERFCKMCNGFARSSEIAEEMCRKCTYRLRFDRKRK